MTSLRTIPRDLQTGSLCQLRTCTRFARLCYCAAGPTFSLELFGFCSCDLLEIFASEFPRLISIVDEMAGYRQYPMDVDPIEQYAETSSPNSADPMKTVRHLHRARLALLCPLSSTSTAPTRTPRLAGSRSNNAPLRGCYYARDPRNSRFQAGLREGWTQPAPTIVPELVRLRA